MDKKSIEIEYKFFIKQKNNIIKILNAFKKPEYVHQFQRTSMYDNKDKLMQKTNGRIRIREFKRKDGLYKSLSYKKPLLNKLKAKREIEYEIFFPDDKENIEKIIKEMGFSLVSSYERYQTLWLIDKTKITLDEYPFVDVLEIEGNLEEINKMASRLDLNIKESLSDPIDTLFTKWREKKGLKFTPFMTFETFDK